MESEHGNVERGDIEDSDWNLQWQKMYSLWERTILSCATCKCKSPLGHKESLARCQGLWEKLGYFICNLFD